MSKPKTVRDMNCVTVEDVHRLRERAIELEKALEVSQRDYEVMAKLCIGAEHERDALAAHVEHLDGLRRNVIEAIKDDRFEDLDVSYYRDDMQPQKPQTSLARLKEEVMIEFLEETKGIGLKPAIHVAVELRNKYRQQAEEVS